MIGKSVRDMVATVAPSLATAFATPLAGMAVRKVADVLDVPATDVAAIENRLRAPSGEEMAQLKVVDAEFRQEMGRLGVELERLAVEDRADARQRETATGDWTPKVLAIAIISAVIAFNAALLFVTPPGGNLSVIEDNNSLLEYLVIAIAAYYFGSSAGSKKKTEMLDPGRARLAALPPPALADTPMSPAGIAVPDPKERPR